MDNKIKKIDMNNYKYSEAQKDLDDIMFRLSAKRYSNLIDGLFIPALNDSECRELYDKFIEFIMCLKNMNEVASSRLLHDMTSEAPSDVFYIKDC